MTDRATTNPTYGSDSAMDPSTDIDNPDNLNFAEPGEEDDQANQEPSQDGIAGETDETAQDAGQETDAPANDEDEGNAEEADETAAANTADETVITLKGGEQVPLKELKLGYMRERDYRVKTSEIANRGRSLEQMTTSVQQTAHAIADFLAQQMPEEPPRTLAMQNPAEYTRQKAIYDSALAQVSQIIDLGKQPQQVNQALTTQQQKDTLERENAALEDAFPTIANNPKAREKFFQGAFSAARDLGFSDQEMQGNTDHRMFKLAHYARLGLAAERAKETALAKVNNAPAVVAKPKASGPGVAQVRKNQDAMKRLSSSGSIKDALQVDFD